MDPDTLQALRRNDPDQRNVFIFPRDFTNERLVEFVAAMQQNTVADIFHIFLGVNNNANLEVEPLIDLLQNRRFLKTVHLWVSDDERMMAGFDNRILRRILQAIARRQSTIQILRLVDFPNVPIEEMVNIIGGRHEGNGLQELVLTECGFRSSPGYNMEQLEAAFRQNTSLKVMELGVITISWLVPIRRMLAASSSVEKLKLVCRNGHANAHSEALGELLAATSTNKLKEVSFNGFFVGVEIPRSVAENEKVTCVEFDNCEFSEVMANEFRRMVFEKSHIKKLGFTLYRGSDFLTLALSVLSRHSSVREFQIDNFLFGLSRLFSQHDFEEMLQLLENDSNLQKLDIGFIDTPEMVTALAASIPKMKLKEFRFRLDARFFHLKPVLMEAFKRNTSLLKIVYYDRENDGFLDDEDVAKLQSYEARNRFLQKWLADPGSVPFNVVPVATRACMHSEDYTVLFQSLRHNVDNIVQAFRKSPAGRIAELEDQVAQQRSVIQGLREQIIELQQQNCALKEQCHKSSGEALVLREEGNERGEDHQSVHKRRRL